MLSPFFLPVEHFGVKFDRGMQLLEFSALREPGRTRFPLIGDFVRSKIDVVRIPHPVMLLSEPMPYTGERYWPDFYISNHTKAFQFAHHAPKDAYLHASNKMNWSNDIDLASASHFNHGNFLHESFIEPFCRKVCGLSTSQIVAKYHRALWLPMYWPETLGTIWETPFYYPAAGYAGILAERLGAGQANNRVRSEGVRSVEINIAYCLASTTKPFSVLFIPELHREAKQSPIYRITDQDVCCGADVEIHRLVVEYRGECDVAADLAVLGITVQDIAYGTGRIVPPTRDNVEAGYDFGRNLNSQLWEVMRGEP